jgi:DNA-binding transcriptional LysR family regulator
MFGRLYVGPVMSAYLKQYSEVSAELRLSDRMVNLVDEGIDLAVRIGHLADSSVVARAVGDMRRIVAASPRYLKAHGTPQKPSDIARHETIQFAGNTSLSEWRFTENGREIRVAGRPRFSTNSTDAAVLHAEQGGGLISVLAYQVAEQLNTGRLRIVLAKYELPPMPIHLVYPTSRLLSAKVRAFIDLVVAQTDWRFGTK